MKIKVKINTKSLNVKKKKSSFDPDILRDLNYDKFKIFLNNNEYIKELDKNEFYEKDIFKDGNCFFRAISYYFNGTEEHYSNYRQLCYEICLNDKDNLKKFYETDNTNNSNLEDDINQYIENIKRDGEYSGDIEINKIAQLMNINIICYITNNNKYILKGVYFGNDDKKYVIPLHFINNNHFEILYPKSFDIPYNKTSFDKNKIMRNYENKENKIINNNDKNQFFKKIYVEYPRNNKNKYNDIYLYLKKGIIPNYIQNIKEAKKRQKKRNNFKKQIKKKYKLENNILYYKYTVNSKSCPIIKESDIQNSICIEDTILSQKTSKEKSYTGKYNYNFIWKKIPYKYEVIPLCNNIHVSLRHACLTKCKQYLLASDYYWEGCTNLLSKIIDECSICCQLKKIESFKPKLKGIITKGPHIRYIADIWELSKEFVEITGYSYILEIIDHFSKWLWCYTLKTKKADEILTNIKKYNYSFGIPKILQVDNGLEFSNKELNLYCENNSIEIIHSSPGHPQTNGAIEVAHKNLQKNIKLDYLINPKNFNLEETIANTLYHYNHIFKHSSTGYTPFYLRDIEDENIINKVLEYEQNIFKRFDSVDDIGIDLSSKFLLLNNAKKFIKKVY